MSNLSRYCLVLAILLIGGVFLMGCRKHKDTTLSSEYLEALEKTHKLTERTAVDPDKVIKAVENFKSLFRNLNLESITTYAQQAYAKDLYFNDTIKEITQRDSLIEYLKHSIEPLESCYIEFYDDTFKVGEVYLRWKMTLRFKKFKKGTYHESIGMTHIRINEEGEIVFHQDYWDTATGVFEHLPILGGIVKKIKSRL